MRLWHATCVRLNGAHPGGAGLLLTGPSGSGKSDLALRLLHRGARLVGDDYVYLGAESGALYAVAPREIAGKLEVRGLGVVMVNAIRVCRVAAVIELCPGAAIERLPEASRRDIEGVSLPCFRLDPFGAAACEKLAMLIDGSGPGD